VISKKNHQLQKRGFSTRIISDLPKFIEASAPARLLRLWLQGRIYMA